jgi:hypothetical protein
MEHAVVMNTGFTFLPAILALNVAFIGFVMAFIARGPKPAAGSGIKRAPASSNVRVPGFILMGAGLVYALAQILFFK